MIATPSPDPAPNSGNQPVLISWNYSYWTTIETKTWPHKIIPGYSFRCHVPVHGKRVCVLFHHPIPKTAQEERK